MTISSGVTYYYMTYNDKRYDIEDYLDAVGVEKIEEGVISGSSNNGANNNETNGNTETTNNTEETENQ